MFKRTEVIMTVGNLEDLIGHAPPGSTGSTELEGQWEAWFAGKAKSEWRFINGQGHFDLIRFKDQELLLRFATVQLPWQFQFLEAVHNTMEAEKSHVLHVLVQWSENRMRTLQMRQWSINNEWVLDIEVL